LPFEKGDAGLASLEGVESQQPGRGIHHVRHRFRGVKQDAFRRIVLSGRQQPAGGVIEGQHVEMQFAKALGRQVGFHKGGILGLEVFVGVVPQSPIRGHALQILEVAGYGVLHAVEIFRHGLMFQIVKAALDIAPEHGVEQEQQAKEDGTDDDGGGFAKAHGATTGKAV